MTTGILSGKKLLFIEDQEFVSSMYKKFFERNGAVVTVAEDGKIGLEVLQKNDVDIIILDRMLSEDMDGFEVLRRIRAEERTKEIPVIILSNLNLKDSELGFIDEHKVAGYYVKAEVSLDVLAQVFEKITLKE